MKGVVSSIGRPAHVDPAWRIGIIHSLFYKEEVDALVDSARSELLSAGIPEENITLYCAAGSFEIPLIGSALAKQRSVDALIGLGVIVEGETHHARCIAEAVARGMMDVQVRTLVPFVFEVLYVATIAQARERLQKGKEAACAALHSLAELKSLG
ncbi:6,7-dimethyl-8-ribityllumazine synthase [Candidatus Peregrinibacteria bacterium CG10_big_fil_rev_8_21_14_0_10_55_24]|nr:MAG: 6,7-dimethyl-8-ribityllumazine synthase [Candidatus Peregrinibacteria bacterium CG10_big_fil_rev_8_21_14_0_10_55_24]